MGGTAGGDVPDPGRDRAADRTRARRPGWIATRPAGAGCTTTQLAGQQVRTAGGESLAAAGVAGRTLSEEETALLFGLLDIALGARVPVSGQAPSTGSTLGVRLTLTPAETSTSVVTVRGVLHLDRLALTVSSAAGSNRSQRPSTRGRRR